MAGPTISFDQLAQQYQAAQQQIANLDQQLAVLKKKLAPKKKWAKPFIYVASFSGYTSTTGAQSQTIQFDAQTDFWFDELIITGYNLKTFANLFPPQSGPQVSGLIQITDNGSNYSLFQGSNGIDIGLVAGTAPYPARLKVPYAFIRNSTVTVSLNVTAGLTSGDTYAFNVGLSGSKLYEANPYEGLGG